MVDIPEVPVFQRNQVRGFSLIEVLLVLAIIGILSGIAIPSFMGQRRRARVIGDAIANAKVLQMSLESRKADNGVYGTAGTYTWTAAGSRPSTDLAPSFIPAGNSQMNFEVLVGSSGLTYTLTVKDTTLGGVNAYITNQAGTETYRLQ